MRQEILSGTNSAGKSSAETSRGGTKGPTTNRPSLEEVKEQFEHWRNTRQKRTTIPEPLWQAAIDLSRKYPVNIISKTLSLSYTDLKRRIKTAGIVKSNNKKVACMLEADTKAVIPNFIGFDFGRAISRECIVEMENPKGGRMKIHFTGNTGDTLVGLAKAFWGTNK